MESGKKLTYAEPHVAIIVDYEDKLVYLFFSCFGRLNFKDIMYLNIVIYRINTLSDYPVSQVF
jgi:hypothetical protein